MKLPLAGFGATWRAFGHREFAIYTAGSSVTLVGLWVQRLGIGWLTWEMTHSGFWLGAVSFADLFPAVVVGPFAGAVADRLDHLRLALICQALSLAQTVLLFVLTATGTIELWSLLSLVLFLGIVRGFYQPIRMLLVPSLVGPDDVPAAVAISSIIFNLARFVGPAIAGLVITLSGVAPTFAVYGATVTVFLLSLAWLRRVRPHGAGTGARPVGGILAQVAAGFRYTWAHAAIGPLLLMMLAGSVLARPVAELFPGFADEVFHRGAGGLAWLTSAVGIGAVLGGVWLAAGGTPRQHLLIALASAGGSATALLVFTATDWFWLAVPSAFAFGLAAVASAIGTQTLILSAVEDGMRGRVLSLYGVIFRGGPAVGSLLMGALSGPFGLRWPLAAGGALCLAAALALWRRRQRMIECLRGAGF